jgi:hypothetical protein
MSGSNLNEESIISSIVDIIKEMEKSVDNIEKILQLLKALDQFSVTMKILKVTKIGKKMSKLSSSKHPEISSQASELVRKWKKAIQSKKEPTQARTEISSQADTQDVQKGALPSEDTKNFEESKPNPRVREADLEYEQQKQEEDADEAYDEFISNNYTQDGIRQNIRKGTVNILL